MKIKVLVTDRIDHSIRLQLGLHKNFEFSFTTKDEVLTLSDLPNFQALWIRSGTQVTKDLLDKMPALRFIVTATSGFDHIDLKATQARGIQVAFTPEANVQAAAEHTWLLLLACVRNFRASQDLIKTGKWTKEKVMGFELSGKTLGIIGLGRIGSRVAQMAQGWGLEVLAYDPYQNDDAFKKLNLERLSYEEVLRSSHLLSFHVPASAETHRMLNAQHFEFLQSGVIIINASRGNVIAESDLVTALKDGLVGAAGLDVFEKEPLTRDNPLLNLPNVVLTPHMGAQTEEAFFRGSESCLQKILAYFSGEQISETLPPVDTWYTNPRFPAENG